MSEAASTAPGPLLEAVDIEAGYAGSTVLAGLSLALPPGRIAAVIGPNGAGKSTLLGTLSGLVRARRGAVRLKGQDATRFQPHQFVQGGVVHVPEGRQVFPSMSVDDNLRLGAFTARRNGAAVTARRSEVLEVFPRLAERLKQDAASLSGGEQQMLAIARGLMGLPSVLLIDEPTLGLAPVAIDRLIEHLLVVRQAMGVAILIAEQNLYLVEALADDAYNIRRGRAIPMSIDQAKSQEITLLLSDQ